MKNRILLFGLTIVVIATIAVFGYTNARYYSAASMSGDLDYVKTIGKISMLHPEWIGGYKGADNGSGVFELDSIPLSFPHIHFEVTNKIDDKINEIEVEYYIRIVAEDGSDDIPIEYDVHEYNNSSNILNYTEDAGYGPFILNGEEEQTEQYSIKVNFTSTKSNHISDVQHLRVQMIRKRSNGSIKVISEAPLNIQYVGTKATATFVYYLYGTTNSIGEPTTIDIHGETTIDFTDEKSLSDHGITIPDGYTFHDLRHDINGAGEYSATATSVTIPSDSLTNHVEVYLVSDTKVTVQLDYYNFQDYTTDAHGNRTYNRIDDSSQTIVVSRGETINFDNESDIEKYKISFPPGYSFQGLNGEMIKNKYTEKKLTIPNVKSDILYIVEVYMIPAGEANVILRYYDASGNSSNIIEEQELKNLGVGTVINFKDASSILKLGIKFPKGYEYNKAYSTDLDKSGAGQDSFTIPTDGANKTYNINVQMNKVINTITVPVKFYNNEGTEVSSTTVDMDSNGLYAFTTDICRILCPELSSMTSFTVYIANQWGSTYDNVGNTSNGKTVTVDYNATYTSWADFRLTDSGTYIYIKAWW